jgi:class 3 adenylate cyclase
MDEGENPQDWRLRRMLLATSVPTDVDTKAGDPIADLFTSTTVVSIHPCCDLWRRILSSIDLMFPIAPKMFADISGFSAWSSEREPCQVFQLLEGLYSGFDQIAHRLGVLKVDTIGDCYVAVAGLRESDTNHAVVMAHYCMECLAMMRELIKDMEVALGPGTADLGMRFGLHSGPVIAGVLRGEKSKFQLFGDTVDTALKMEVSSDVGAILVSQDTANLLVACGKEDWLSERHELISIKGKGKLKVSGDNEAERLFAL